MVNEKKTGIGKLTALGGVLLALSMVCLYGASFVPGIEITLYSASSVFIAVMMIEGRGKGAWLLYAACSLMALLILPNKAAVVPYIFFFGIYAVLKGYIEKLKNPVLQYIIKFGAFTLLLVIAYKFFYSLFFGVITVKEGPILIMLLVGEIFFLVYDMLLSWIIGYYYRRFYGRI